MDIYSCNHGKGSGLQTACYKSTSDIKEDLAQRDA